MSDDIASALACAKKGHINQAIAIIEEMGDPFEVADAYAALVKRVYRESRDVTAMVALAEAACRFCLRRAAQADDAQGKRLKQSARVTAYNAAANCWPGWGDEGVVIEAEHLQAGLTLARMSRDLVLELHPGNKALGGAHWIIGALELASGQLSYATASFSQAEETFQAHGDKAYVLMAQGYAALARKMDSQSGESDLRLTHILDQLHADGSKDAAFFAEQITRAEPLLAAFVPALTARRL